MRARAPVRSGRLAPLSAAARVITTRDGAQDSPVTHRTAHRNRSAAQPPVVPACRKRAGPPVSDPTTHVYVGAHPVTAAPLRCRGNDRYPYTAVRRGAARRVTFVGK